MQSRGAPKTAVPTTTHAISQSTPSYFWDSYGYVKISKTLGSSLTDSMPRSSFLRDSEDGGGSEWSLRILTQPRSYVPARLHSRLLRDNAVVLSDWMRQDHLPSLPKLLQKTSLQKYFWEAINFN